jgi:hypothetical protein
MKGTVDKEAGRCKTSQAKDQGSSTNTGKTSRETRRAETDKRARGCKRQQASQEVTKGNYAAPRGGMLGCREKGHAHFMEQDAASTLLLMPGPLQRQIYGSVSLKLVLSCVKPTDGKTNLEIAVNEDDCLETSWACICHVLVAYLAVVIG